MCKSLPLPLPPLPLPAAGADLTNNGLTAGAAAAALTLAVPAGRLLATDRSRRRLGNRLKARLRGLGCWAVLGGWAAAWEAQDEKGSWAGTSRRHKLCRQVPPQLR